MVTESGRILYSEQPPTEDVRLCCENLEPKPTPDNTAIWNASRLPQIIKSGSSRVGSSQTLFAVTRQAETDLSQAGTEKSRRKANSGSRQ